MVKRIKNNNFDFLRFLFAIFVVISHAYALSGGAEENTGINKLSNGQLSFSQIGLSGFFIISGYFIFQSLQRSKSLLIYYKKRFLRIFPALVVVLCLSLILVAFVYTGEVSFFKNKEVYTYIPYNVSLYGFQSSIQGVFDTNTYRSINGSLWSIRYEFSLYIALSFLFFIRNKKWIISYVLSLTFFVFYILYNFYLPKFAGASFMNLLGLHILNLGTFFIAGSVLASLQLETFKNKKTLLFVAVSIFLCSPYFNYYDLVNYIVLPFLILLIGFVPFIGLKDFFKLGDASYGIYIYSFPIQQTLMWFFKMNTYTLMLYSIFLSIGFGFLSWHLIEKQALKLKQNV
ncbi:acyltransferase [Mariniflexile litorale]|uniref:Acyltransferase n=1 Tax=Mariniflexile litorale TaxID=3045158 RepID=A0AAU7ECT8_9FLAO|nr:acyltransferase [Mariniflexile sp. KMM 9835]MDQ8212214.1 acyltransferase [Mariniflexile sp. KMM 9835]